MDSAVAKLLQKQCWWKARPSNSANAVDGEDADRCIRSQEKRSPQSLPPSGGLRLRRQKLFTGRQKLRGAARAFNRYRKSKDAMWRKPMKHVRIYIKEIETELGVEGGDLPYNRYQPVGLHEEDPVWQAEGLFRCHFLVSYILKHLLDDDKESAALMAVLTLRCLHQVALDSGNWMLTTLKDLLSRRRWGGEPGHLETAADYLRTVQDLEKRTRQVTWGNLDQNPNETADTPEGDKVWKPPKRAGKGQDKRRLSLRLSGF